MFYGWRIVATTLVTHFVSFGFLFYSYGVFFKTFAAELGGSRLGVSLGLTLTQVITAVLAPLLGRLLDQGAIRRVMCLGATLMACGFFVGSQVVALWQFYLVLGLMLAAGAAMLGGLPGSTLVANWFVRRRGLALGISSVGISLSGAVMFPVATLLIGELGWRTTFLFYGMFALLFVVPTVLLVVVNRPEDMGLHPDGAARLPPSAKADAPEPLLPLAVGDQMIDHPGHLEWSARGVLRESNFWLIALVISLNFSSIGAVLTHIVPHATDLGFTPERAGFVGSIHEQPERR